MNDDTSSSKLYLAFNRGDSSCFFSKSLLSSRIPVDTKSFEVTKYLNVEKIDVFTIEMSCDAERSFNKKSKQLQSCLETW